jgi:hypothetical protein
VVAHTLGRIGHRLIELRQGQGGQRQVEHARDLQQLRMVRPRIDRYQADKVRALGVDGREADVEKFEDIIGSRRLPQANAGHEARSCPNWQGRRTAP